MQKISVMIVEDHKLLREAWTEMFSSDQKFKVLAACPNAHLAVALAKQKHPNIILMDINLGDMNGIDATKMISKLSPRSKVIGLSMHEQPVYAKKMIQAGAKGYITKNSSRDELLHAIAKVSKGETYICKEVRMNMEKADPASSEVRADITILTGRELEIADYIRKGDSSKEIGSILNIKMKTVEVHRHNILKKLNLKSSIALVNLMNHN